MQFFLLGRVKLNVSFITKESFWKQDTKLVHGVAGLPLSGRSQGENLFFFFGIICSFIAKGFVFGDQ